MDTIFKNLSAADGAQVRMLISDNNWLESSAVEQLKKTATLPGMCCAVGMPDLHPGKGQPIGAAFISRNVLYPHLVGSDIGCGMGLWQLEVNSKRIRLDRWQNKLLDLDGPWQGDSLAWLREHGCEIEKQDASYSQNKLGSIGGGNHFAEIQRLKNIFSADLFRQTGLPQQAVVLLVHSGSRGLGQKLLRQHVEARGAAALSSGTEAMVNYLTQHNFAQRWAVLNRQLIAQRFCQRLGVASKALLDVCHNTVSPLPSLAAKHMGLAGDAEYWIHRKGASPTDQGLVMIPGSRGSLSYLVKPRLGNRSALVFAAYSLAHGAGRKWRRSDVRGRLEARFKVRDLETTAIGSRVICKPRDLLYEEAPQAYKNIDVVVEDLVSAGLIDVVASFTPLISYKTRRLK